MEDTMNFSQTKILNGLRKEAWNNRCVLMIYLTVLFCSCNCRTENCDSHSAFLAPAKSLPLIKLDFSKSKEELETYIRTAVIPSDFKSALYFALELNKKVYNASIHAAHINQFACFGMPAMQHKSPQLQVVLNQKGQVIMEGKDLISIDSIPSYIEWYYPHNKPFGEKIVHLECVNSPPASFIEATIEKIGEGYMMYYRKRAFSSFEKTLCELDSVQSLTVRKKYPFELRLWIGDKSPISKFKPSTTSCRLDI